MTPLNQEGSNSVLYYYKDIKGRKKCFERKCFLVVEYIYFNTSTALKNWNKKKITLF